MPPRPGGGHFRQGRRRWEGPALRGPRSPPGETEVTAAVAALRWMAMPPRCRTSQNSRSRMSPRPRRQDPGPRRCPKGGGGLGRRYAMPLWGSRRQRTQPPTLKPLLQQSRSAARAQQRKRATRVPSPPSLWTGDVASRGRGAMAAGVSAADRRRAARTFAACTRLGPDVAAWTVRSPATSFASSSARGPSERRLGPVPGRGRRLPRGPRQAARRVRTTSAKRRRRRRMPAPPRRPSPTRPGP
mmetsp:Transcript_66227/g.184419  ORF Transcript_66227/g.184419 Transcript_66227/m.184419 type:complete len:243 (+) Transcript_66227:386-1114(+)